jgi:hypothetical protein
MRISFFWALMLLFSPAFSLGARPPAHPRDLVRVHRIQTGVRRGISIKRGAAAFKIPSASELGGVGAVANAVAVRRDSCLKQGAHDDTAVNKGRFGTKAPFTSVTV